MVSAEMFWGRSDWAWPTDDRSTLSPEFVSGRLQIDGCITSSFEPFSSFTRRLSTTGQFFLGVDRMPDTGCTFRSAPEALFTGIVRASVGPPASIFDFPSARCTLTLTQIVLVDGAVVTSSDRRINLVRISNEWRESRAHRMSRSRAFDPVFIELDRSHPLQINLEVELEFWIEGVGGICLSPRETDPSFSLRLPQWSIESTA